MEHMRSTLVSLEQALPVMLTLDTDDVAWEGFLSPKALRIRHLIQQTLVLTKEVRQLEAARYQLQSLLREHQVASRVLSGLLRGNPVAQDWEEDVKRWRQLTRIHFRPWTRDECQEEMDAALKQVNAFQWTTEKQTSNISFQGWGVSSRVDSLRGAFQFQATKTIRGCDMMDYVRTGWAAYTDPEAYKEVIAGHRVHAYLEVLQELEPHLKLVRSAERFPEFTVNAHSVNVVFRVPTERGYTQCVRSVCCPELMKANDGLNDMWPSDFIWLQWEPLESEGDGAYRMRAGASLRGSDSTYGSQWMVEALGCLIRSEQLGTKKQLLISS
jgi:hypothetical protein